MAGKSALRNDMRAATNVHLSGRAHLLLHNVTAKLSPEELITLLCEEGFHPEDLEIRVSFEQTSKLAEITVTLPADEGSAAHKWAQGQEWGGQRFGGGGRRPG